MPDEWDKCPMCSEVHESEECPTVPGLLAEVARLRTALAKYGQHIRGCPSHTDVLFSSRGNPDVCDCGFAATLAGAPDPEVEESPLTLSEIRRLMEEAESTPWPEGAPDA